MKSKKQAAPGLNVVLDVLAIPYNFLSGFATGLAAPVAAIAGMVALIRLLTGKVPYLGHIYVDDEGQRHLSFKLVPPDEVKDLFEEQKEEIGGDIAKMQAEIKAIVEETKAAAKEKVQTEQAEA